MVGIKFISFFSFLSSSVGKDLEICGVGGLFWVVYFLNVYFVFIFQIIIVVVFFKKMFTCLYLIRECNVLLCLEMHFIENLVGFQHFALSFLDLCVCFLLWIIIFGLVMHLIKAANKINEEKYGLDLYLHNYCQNNSNTHV